ncbi:MAG: hypothetical protein A3C50_00705 [Candidatus Staskawiczbacteria bacterium RIFCSPHIGHO2_02_FULL_43_16]|uniref:alanine--tRNA ligase n=1 Tax=Candidatus Staskawiczbacteria bacterium RIFCSPHIGHO2_01_FULL_41_41 TaxID=1802203 RepID=A0A1G2HVM3_9BACT|nr:MAG: hypothetical protein A2822_00185 [Candidatus Staskawiczbacteria bacterium RIFCSPHIGHO2_01_FULL_41_41]OGZ68278.1 MAG: hypothetical protein A3C50_00705 [Candidatus Staskawiczbacteria bacterium RIFCSPHIGHO2_02_FULL_43_16]OGZ74667.1 MAG: hypothetical protein A3A12_00800 [Candidatus Staskawiczbacteria bacterium RIFCSPLOWO2_01_FULL_43_17b]
MNSTDLRQKFLDFFEKHGHKIVPSSSLLPTDPSVLFTTAGMQQFKSYYLGENSPWGKNVTSCQKCIRTSDIEEVGDERHLTFFEMLGNFSFGGYWKKEAIGYAYGFVVKELGLEIDYVTVFEGEAGVPEDKESAEIWKSIDSNIVVKKFGRTDNFWGPTGEEGPCGPTTEIYVNGIEIWNIVFNEFYQQKDKTLKPLEIKGVDTGMGLERLAMVAQKVPTVFDTDIFGGAETKEGRIIADHTRAISALIADGVLPSNKNQGYILRRLMRRVMTYSNFSVPQDPIWQAESEAFNASMKEGLKHVKETMEPKEIFSLYETYGLPVDVLRDKVKNFDQAQFDELLKKHQELSRTASAGMFKGGLADHDPKTIKLHTAHHLLLAALQELFGKEVKQKGSNINQERLRIDFSFGRKITDEEKKKLEDMVNEKIHQGLDVVKKEMPLEEAQKIGAEMEFGVKYGNTVSVYFIVPTKTYNNFLYGIPYQFKNWIFKFIGKDKNGEIDLSNVVSKEFCGGPHVLNTSELGKFKIIKEEASSQGVRRIKAILE